MVMGGSRSWVGFGVIVAAAAVSCAPGDRVREDVFSVQQAVALDWCGTNPDRGSTELGGKPGGATVCNADGSLTVSSPGDGIFQDHADEYDEVRFVWQRVVGDAEIVVRVDEFTSPGGGAPSANAHVGVAIRSDASAQDARMVSGYVSVHEDSQSASRGLRDHSFVSAFRSVPGRWQAAGNYRETRTPPRVVRFPWDSPSTPVWMRLQVVGSDVAVSRSVDGVNWVAMGSRSGGPLVRDPGGVAYVGMFVSGRANVVHTARFSQILVRTPPVIDQPSAFIGASHALPSTGSVGRGLTGMFVAPDGTTFKTTLAGEGVMLQRFRFPDGNVTANVSIFGGRQGGLTGDLNNLYVVSYPELDKPQQKITRFRSSDLATLTVSTRVFDQIGGMALAPSPLAPRLYVAEVSTGLVHVLDPDTLQDIVPSASFAFTGTVAGAQPGPMAVDARGDIWILQPSVDYPIPGSSALVRPAALRSFTGGVFNGRQVSLDAQGQTVLKNPSAMVYDAANDRLLVAEAGLWTAAGGQLRGQNVRKFGSLTTTPAEVLPAFGQEGGVYSGATPGLLEDPAAGGARRFYTPTGVGLDSAGNIYVSSGRMVDIRGYNPTTPSSPAVLTIAGLLGDETGAFAPDSNGTEYYTTTKRFTKNPTPTSPADAWRFHAVTWSPNGGEGTNEEHARAGYNAMIRVVGASRFMYTIGGPGLTAYRFVGELAKPCASFTITSGQIAVWADDGAGGGIAGDGIAQSGEITTRTAPSSGFRSASVDSDGTVWLAYDSGGYVGFAAPTIVNGALKYTVASSVSAGVPPPLASVLKLFRDPSNGRMVVLGVAPDVPDGTAGSTDCGGVPDGALFFPIAGGIGKAIRFLAYARFDNWPAPPAAPTAATCQYVKNAPHPYTSPNFVYVVDTYPGWTTSQPPQPETQIDGEHSNAYTASDVAGDKLFLNWQSGPIQVIDVPSGQVLQPIAPGPEVGGAQIWLDVPDGMRAVKTDDGRYLVSSADSNYQARNLLFTWAPAGAPPQSACNIDADCATTHYCQAGSCLTRPCGPSDPFIALNPVFSTNVSFDGFTLAESQLDAFVSRTTGGGNYDIYATSRASLTSAFDILVPVSGLATANQEQVPTLSKDGLTLYFAGPNGANGTDVLVTTRSAGQTFSPPQSASSINGPARDDDPYLAADGTALYFVSDRVATEGRNLYAASMVGGLGAAVPLANVNSNAEESHPVLTRDGKTLYFGSRRVGPNQDSDGDIWVATRTGTTGDFSSPSHLSILNSSGIDLPVGVAADGCGLYLISNRHTGLGGTQALRVYEARRGTPPSQVTMTMVVTGSGSVTTTPFNCTSSGGPGCVVSRPYGTTLLVYGSSAANWSGGCEANGSPGLSTDANVAFTVDTVCNVSFPSP